MDVREWLRRTGGSGGDRVGRVTPSGDATRGGRRDGDRTGLGWARLDALKYRVYLAVSSIGAFAVPLSWLLERPVGASDAFDHVSNPLLTLFCATLAAILFWKKEGAVRFVELGGYAGVVAFFLSNSYYLLYVDYGRFGAAAVDELSEFSSWVPVASVLAYLVLGTRAGLAASVLFHASLVAIGLPRMISSAPSGEGLGRV